VMSDLSDEWPARACGWDNYSDLSDEMSLKKVAGVTSDLSESESWVDERFSDESSVIEVAGVMISDY
jgi:hypothetical protein